MRTSLSILASLAIAGLAFTPLHAADAKVAAKEAVKKPAPVAAHKGDPLAKEASFADDLDALSTAVTLSEEQKKKLQFMKDACAKELAKYDKDNESRVTSAQGKLDKVASEKGDRADQARKEIKAYLDSIKMGRDAIIAASDKKMFAALTPEQRGKWNTPILKNEMIKEFSLVFLEPKQEERIGSFCAQQAKSLAQPLDVEKAAKSLDGLKGQVYKTILTPKQQAEYRKIKTPAPLDKKEGAGH